MSRDEAGARGYGTSFQGIGGTIKLREEDFEVSELLSDAHGASPSLKGRGFPLFAVTKRGRTTGEAKSAMERALRVRLNVLGLKDRAAVVHQFASARGRGTVPAEWRTPGVRALYVADTREPLARSDLFGNAFRVVVSGAREDGSRLRELRDSLRGGLVPNFYGGQRFGSRRPNHLVGRAIVKGEFGQACGLAGLKEGDGAVGALRRVPLPIRRLYVNAYQSYLFNRCLSGVLEGGGLPAGELCIGRHPDAVLVDGRIRRAGEVGGSLLPVPLCPLPGYAFRDRGDAYSRAMAAVLAEEGVAARDFFVKEMQEVSAEGGLRPASMIGWVRGWRMGGGVELRFVLYRGSYATVLLREAVK
ncbi:MAG: tRNA pseudouridine(13) synthase TruD [Nitrososphaerota archaeon]|nr:tRNA pseudouridine(13) synthase TruD [Nitrososphaerota archaeon]